MKQKYSGANTSVNHTKPPAIANLVNKIDGWRLGTINVDLGCGAKPHVFSDWLYANKSIYNMPLDPYWEFEADERLLSVVGATSVTISNVLNVIKEKRLRLKLLRQAKNLGATYIYITVYEGDKSGKGRETKPDCWQENRDTESYLSEVKQVFKGSSVQRIGKLIVVVN
jgi:hypothetical protein